MRDIIKRFTAIILMAALAFSGVEGFVAPLSAAPKTENAAGKSKSGKKRSKKSSGHNSKKNGNSGTSKKGSAKGKDSSKTSRKGSSRKGSGKRTETSADVKRRHEEAQREVKLTQQQIRENDAAVKKNLAELGKLEGDITVSKERVAAAGGKVATLQKQITGLQAQISRNEKEVEKMRAEYLKAVKKIRLKKKGNSNLAFIFSSKNFNEALRRMRYLRQFSDWKEKQTAEIGEKVKVLKKQTEQLGQAKKMQDHALAEEIKARNSLQTQYNQQDAIVVELKKNGAALKDHLARKQAEVNTLRGQVAALIAAEQRKAEEERRAREAAERRAEEERAARAAREEAARKEQEQLLAEQEARQREESAAKEKQKPSKSEQAKKSKKESEKLTAQETKKESRKRKSAKAPKQDTKQTKVETNKNSGGNSYAEARKRRPRKPSAGSSASSTPASNASAPRAASSGSAGNFAAMKGSLPRPVSGAFKVTSRFGRHSLPDLPDVMYDNPGIDAECSAGASALAVYGGKVSGIYMIPGFSTVVIVNHGGYYTVYGNIASAGVKVGDVVKQGQQLGRLAADEDDPSHSTIHFEVWKNRDKLDPLTWIR